MIPRKTQTHQNTDLPLLQLFCWEVGGGFNPLIPTLDPLGPPHATLNVDQNEEPVVWKYVQYVGRESRSVTT